jgi:hypothetical protein
VVDAGMARGYPHRRPATRLATRALRGNPYDLPEPAPLTAEAAIAGMRATASPGGLLVSFPGRD